MIRLSANLGFMWPDRPLLERIAAAGRTGFEAIELHWPYDVPAADIAAACRSSGVMLLGLNTRVGNATVGEFGLGALPGREADFAAAFDQSLDYCRATGANSIHAMAGVVQDTPRTATTLVANLKVASSRAADAGVTILLEAINPRDRAGYFYHRVERAAEIIADVGAPNVKLMYDAYHVGVGQGDVFCCVHSLSLSVVVEKNTAIISSAGTTRLSARVTIDCRIWGKPDRKTPQRTSDP